MMEGADDSDDGVEMEEIEAATGNSIVPNGTLKTEQVLQSCSEYHQALCQQYRIFKDNMVSCSSMSPLNSIVPIPTQTVINQANHLQHGIMAAQQTGNIPEQLMVAVQNINATAAAPANMEDGEPKTIINSGQITNSIQMPKMTNATAHTNSLQHMATSGAMLAPAQLAGMMSLASLPQVTALTGLNGIPGLNVVQQIAPQPQVIQQQVSNAGCITNTQMPSACHQSMAVSINGQPQTVQSVQQQQITNTPQFILAAGQPIQGIQGAQLLIPTSSGVATQQVITIPVSQLAGNQVVQLVASNGQIFTTTLANLQALSQPVPVPGIAPASIPANPQAVHHHPMLTSASYANMAGQMAALPQIFTNPAGQLVTLGPQVIAHPMMSANQPTNLVVNPQVAAQMQQIAAQHDDKNSGMPPIAHTNGMTNSIVRPSNSSLSAISQALAMQQQSQAAHIAINPVTMVATQVTSPQKSQHTNGHNYPLAPKLPPPSGTVSALTQTIQPQPSVSPLNDLENGLNQAVNTISNTEANVVDGINLEEIKDFAKAFKIRRLSLGLTQTQVGQALSATEGPSYSQSAICRFEKLDITPRSAQKIKPVLERWMKEAEERYKNGAHTLTEFIGSEPTKKRKRRTSFTPAALDILNQFFEKNTHPTGLEMTELAEHLNYDREVVRVWFCNKRQALKNTIKKLKSEVPL